AWEIVALICISSTSACDSPAGRSSTKTAKAKASEFMSQRALSRLTVPWKQQLPHPGRHLPAKVEECFYLSPSLLRLEVNPQVQVHRNGLIVELGRLKVKLLNRRQHLCIHIRAYSPQDFNALRRAGLVHLETQDHVTAA